MVASIGRRPVNPSVVLHQYFYRNARLQQQWFKSRYFNTYNSDCKLLNVDSILLTKTQSSSFLITTWLVWTVIWTCNIEWSDHVLSNPYWATSCGVRTTSRHHIGVTSSSNRLFTRRNSRSVAVSWIFSNIVNNISGGISLAVSVSKAVGGAKGVVIRSIANVKEGR